MAESEKYKPPEPTTGDTAHLVARGALSVIPGLSELFEYFVASPLERRRDDWMARVGEALRDLEENRGLDLKELQSNEVFIDTVLQASQIAFRNSQAEKRAALRNAILNAALADPPEQALQQIFLSFVDRFTVWHLRLLKLFDSPPQWAREHHHSFPVVNFGSLARVLVSAFPELDGKRAIYERVWKDLYQEGLVNTDNLHTTMSKQGVRSKRTTELGTQFLRFIEEPE